MTFRILSLPGGGVRGLLQASYLEHLENSIDGAVSDRFDLIAGTSTGALVALGLAAEASPSMIRSLYEQHSAEIFTPAKKAPLFRRGARYSQDPLRDALGSILGSKNLGQLATPVLVPAATVDRYDSVLLSSKDESILAVDAALSTAAAPTYFEPVSPLGSSRSFVDGGLWANDPTLLAVLHAISEYGADLDQIKVLTIGTGSSVPGTNPESVKKARTVSLETFRYLMDILGSTQTSGMKLVLDGQLEESQWCRVDPPLPAAIGLDDHETALAVLPGIAESEFTQDGQRVIEFLDTPRASSKPELEHWRDALRWVADAASREEDILENVETTFTVGSTRDGDQIAARITTTVKEGTRPIRWRRMIWGSDAPAPSFGDAQWSARCPATDTTYPVLICGRGPNDLDGLVWFDTPIEEGQSLEWEYRLRWPGFFDSLRADHSDWFGGKNSRPGEFATYRLELPPGLVLKLWKFEGEGQLDGPYENRAFDGSSTIDWRVDSPATGQAHKITLTVEPPQPAP